MARTALVPTPTPTPMRALDSARALRSTGAQAASTEEKLTLATELLEGGEHCIFPDRHRFVLDWLCGAFKAKGSGPAAQPPRADARFWRLLQALLHAAAGQPPPSLPEPPPLSAPPALNLPAGLRARLAQSSRLVLQSAAAALAHESGEPAGDAELWRAVRAVVGELLVRQASWFQPGSGAVAEFVASTARRGAAAIDALSPHDTGAGANAAPPLELLRCAELGISSALGLQAQLVPRKMLQLVASSLLEPLLELRAACAACAERAEPSLAHSAPSAREALREVCAGLERVPRQVDLLLRDVLLHGDHLPEYASAMLPAESGKGDAEAGEAGEGMERDPDQEEADGAKSRGKKRARDAAAAPASRNYSSVALAALAGLLARDVEGASSRSAAEAAAAAAPAAAAASATAAATSSRAILLPILPSLLGDFAAVFGAQQGALAAERSSRQRLLGGRYRRAATFWLTTSGACVEGLGEVVPMMMARFPAGLYARLRRRRPLPRRAPTSPFSASFWRRCCDGTLPSWRLVASRRSRS